MSQKPDPLRPGLPFQMNLRLSSAHWRGVSFLARTRGVTLAEACRQTIEHELATFKNADGVTFWDALQADDSIDLTTDELADLATEDAPNA